MALTPTTLAVALTQAEVSAQGGTPSPAAIALIQEKNVAIANAIYTWILTALVTTTVPPGQPLTVAGPTGPLPATTVTPLVGTGVLS